MGEAEREDPARPGRSRARVALGVGLGLGVALALLLAPTGLRDVPGHGDRPARAAAVAALMAVLWLTEALPIALTACLPLLLYPLLGVFGKGPAGDLYRSAEPFWDAYIFLFLGGMAIGASMEHFGLHRRLALHVMRRIGTRPERLLLGVLVATASVSMWISNTATAVMMVPIGAALVAQLERGLDRRLPSFGAAIMLAVAYAANVGGIGTKIGTGTNSIFAGFLADRMGIDLGFLQYMALGVPLVALLVPVLWLALWLLGRKDRPGEGLGPELLDAELEKLGPWKPGERRVAWVFGLAALLWVLGDPIRAFLAPLAAELAGLRLAGKHVEAATAMLAALTLAASGSLPLAAIRRIPYGTLLLLGGSFAMAAGIEGSGLGVVLASKLAALGEMPLFSQVALASFATVLLSAIASNTATINVALNVLPPSMPVLSASALAASCDFALPAGTPPNAIVFGSGYVRLPTMMRVGALLDVVAAALIAVYVVLYGRHVLP